MKKFLLLILRLTFSLLFVLLLGCENNIDAIVVDPPVDVNSKFTVPSVADAKKHLERTNNFKNPFDKSDLLSKNKESDFYIDWSASKVKQFKFQDSLSILYTPVNQKIKGKRVKSLVASIVNEGEVESYLYTLLYKSTSTNDAFSGAIAKFNINGTLSDVYLYNDGEMTKRFVADEISATASCDPTWEDILADIEYLMEMGGGSMVYLDCVTVTAPALEPEYSGGSSWHNPDFGLPSIYIPGNFGSSGGGGNGGNYNAPFPNNNTDSSPVTNDLLWWQQEMAEVLSSLCGVPLTQAQTQYVNDPNNADTLFEILTFLNSNSLNGSPSLEASNFALASIDALANGGEVDTIKKIIYDNSVPQCLKIIMENLKNKSTKINLVPDLPIDVNLSSFVLNLFENNSYHNLKVQVAPLPNGLNASTTPSSIGGGIFLYTITISDSYLNNATDLAVARTLIHESVHAYLSYNFQANPFSSLSITLNNLLSQNSYNTNLSQHQIMVDFVKAMAYSLQTWHNNKLGELNYYNYLSWSGDMLNTPAFNNLSNSFQTNVRNANIAEGQAGSGNGSTSAAKGHNNCK